MELTIWGILTDVGLISLLLLLGMFLRAKVNLLQRSFMPASIIAGILGLVLGPNGFNIIPFTGFIGDYPGVLIAVVFAAIPLSTPRFKWSQVINKVGGLWSYSQTIMLLMWGGGLLFALVLLVPLFDVHNGFGLLLAAGFVGGHGTAAAIGDAFAQQGWEEATSLAMTSATIGAILAIVVGLALIRSSANKGHANYISRFDELPEELRTGILPKNKRSSMGSDTVSSISIDPLVFHLALVLFVTMVGYYLSQFGESLYAGLSIPAFSLAFLVGLILKQLMQATNVDEYLDRGIMSKISGSATDILVAFGIASINLTVIADNLVPFIILILFGIFLSYFFYKVVSKFYFRENWFEKGIFTFGWVTGAVAMAIALLRIVDPKLESKTLDEFGLAYIPIAPVEVFVITFAPIFVLNGQHWLFSIITIVISAVILIFSYYKKWAKFNYHYDYKENA
ncbi:sodium/glutamate symporter [Texcoconibacillus texcoconensis]|uniref:ESS family glutamate:Na+ symporter n=1 Tax=Texcoconibacillus texcoconensis TaxID=1095777 RepID=A0A840QIK7_9BACI|nr:sodium/glutamate symporter [Texcoconibacillus texcoconensis]MBB5171895.1 ESS family glutamate:Na+ symporter [Texcoconibacillus texcoconensis]